MNEDKKYLFVWTEVLSDHTDGIAFAIAKDVEDTYAIIIKKAGYELDLPLSKMKKYELNKSIGFYVYGGA